MQVFNFDFLYVYMGHCVIIMIFLHSKTMFYEGNATSAYLHIIL